MSVDQEVVKLVLEPRGDGKELVAGAIAEAYEEVQRLLEATVGSVFFPREH